MKNIAIITARGGSKRIPRKNIKEFMGKPMLAYAVEAAVNSKVFDEVMVSTDDVEIAEIAKQFGAKVPFMRSEKTANDFATTADVLDAVISEYKKRGKTFDELCCIYPCVPFLTADVINNAYEKFVTAQMNLNFYNDKLLKNSDEMIRVSKRSYEVGKSNLTSLIVMEQSYKSIIIGYTYALADYYNCWINFLREVNQEELKTDNEVI